MTAEFIQPIKSLGSIYTPADFAELLSSWAITNKNQRVLDLGVGEGSITFAVYKQLLALGASKKAAQKQIYGTEVDLPTYSNFQKLLKDLKITFPNIQQQDFFTFNFPEVDVVIGNPPYVRRSKIDNFDVIKNVFSSITNVSKNLSALTDLYVYFILQACTKLKDGG